MKCSDKAGFMVVRIRFGRGPVVTRRKGKNARLATMAAVLLTMGSISCASLGIWRLGVDLGWTGDFVVQSGLLSHWMVWLVLAGAAQYGSRQFQNYAAASHERALAAFRAEADQSSSPDDPSAVRAIARV